MALWWFQAGLLATGYIGKQSLRGQGHINNLAKYLLCAQYLIKYELLFSSLKTEVSHGFNKDVLTSLCVRHCGWGWFGQANQQCLPFHGAYRQEMVQKISDRKKWDTVRENRRGLNWEGFSEELIFKIKPKEGKSVKYVKNGKTEE